MNITVDCVGDVIYLNTNIDRGEIYNSPIDDKCHYKYADLPGNVAMFVININNIEMRLEFNMTYVPESDFRGLIDAITSNRLYCLEFPGKSAEIIHENSIVEFHTYGIGTFCIKVPSISVIECLLRMI